jgi:hypothetical protein
MGEFYQRTATTGLNLAVQLELSLTALRLRASQTETDQ